MRRRYPSAPAWHSPHVLKVTRGCFRLKTQMCPLRWRCLLEFYDHRETRIRVVDSHRAQQELFELLSWVRNRWWLVSRGC